jgi:hypothetical protein
MFGLVVDIALREILIFAAVALLTLAILATDDDSGSA